LGEFHERSQLTQFELFFVFLFLFLFGEFHCLFHEEDLYRM